MLASPRLQQHLTFGSCSSTPGRLIGSVYIVGKLHTWPHRSTDRDTTLRLTGRCQLCLYVCPLFSATPMHVKKLWLLFLQIQCVNARRKSPPIAWRLFSSSAREREGSGEATWADCTKRWGSWDLSEKQHMRQKERAVSPGAQQWERLMRQDVLKWLLEVIFKVIFKLRNLKFQKTQAILREIELGSSTCHHCSFWWQRRLSLLAPHAWLKEGATAIIQVDEI